MMARLFSDEWMRTFAETWNADNIMLEGSSDGIFSATIGFGCGEDDIPTGVLVIQQGRVVYAGAYNGQPLDWDMRADIDSWQAWLREGFGLNKLGYAVSTGKLSFLKGDYRKMIHNPNMAKSFLRHFELMQHMQTDFAC